jgi:hypothetical protein
MKFEITVTMMDSKNGVRVESCKTIALRNQDEITETFHDMRLGEIRELNQPGYHITRIG